MVTAAVYMPVVARVRCWRFSVSDFLISYFRFPNFPFLLFVTPQLVVVMTNRQSQYLPGMIMQLVSTNHLVANTVNNQKCSVPCNSLATFLHVDFVLHTEQLPLTSLSHASLLSINPDALKLELKLVIKKLSSDDSILSLLHSVMYPLWLFVSLLI